MDIGEILVLTLSVPAMCLLLVILVRVEEWLGEDTNDGWASRPAGARRRLLLPVHTTSHIGHIWHDSKHLAKLLVLRANRADADLTFKRQ
jgi:hypothetical protein